MKKPFLAIFSLVLLIAPEAQQTLILGSFPTTAPYLIFKNQKPDGGIVKDLADKISHDLGVNIEYYFPPKNRTDFAVEKKLLTVLPVCNPQWVNNPDHYYWSAVLFTERGVFATDKRSKMKIDSIGDLQGLNVGTITGYFYPEFKDLLSKKIFTIDPSQSLFRNLNRLNRQWINVIYDSDILLKYKAKDPNYHLEIQPLVLSTKEIFWAIPKSAAVDHEKIFEKLKKYLKDGTMEEILNRYR